tara:strand:- start:559 stop:783 length:225 start_codon:yes stop_codon:yes gene_type:complete
METMNQITKGELVKDILNLHGTTTTSDFKDVEYYLNTLTKDELHNVLNDSKFDLEYETGLYFYDGKGYKGFGME